MTMYPTLLPIADFLTEFWKTQASGAAKSIVDLAANSCQKLDAMRCLLTSRNNCSVDLPNTFSGVSVKTRHSLLDKFCPHKIVGLPVYIQVHAIVEEVVVIYTHTICVNQIA
jgi:hypothetical protein